MKKISEKGGKWGLVAAGAAIIILPVTLATTITGDYLDIGHYGAIGYSNGYQMGGSLLVGYGNSSNGSFSAAIGTGLIADGGNQVVVGHNNEVNNGCLFIVGNGTWGDPSNAFEVRNDGSVIVNEAQGDISMGGFGN